MEQVNQVVLGDNFNADMRLSLEEKHGQENFVFSLSSRIDTQFNVTTKICGVSSSELQQLALCILSLSFELQKKEYLKKEKENDC